MTEFLLQSLLVFTVNIICDIFWTLYITHATDGNKLSASIHSMMIVLCGGLTVLQYVDNQWLLIPGMLGAFVGVYGTLLYKEWRDKKNGKTSDDNCECSEENKRDASG